MKKHKKRKNMYEWTYYNKKKIIGSISAILIVSLLIGLFSQFSFAFI